MKTSDLTKFYKELIVICMESYASQKQEWISVKDRLLGNGQTIIATTSDNDVFPAEWDYDENDNMNQLYDLEAQCYVPRHQKFIAWMPLPEPPKSE